MRILQVLGTSTGGVGTHVRAVVRELCADHEVGIIAPTSTLVHFDLTGEQISTQALEMSTRMHLRDFGVIRQLRAQINAFAPDIIHAHGFRAAFLTLVAADKRPVVASWHNQATGTGVKGWLEARVESFIARKAALVIGASEDLAERAREVGGRNVVCAPVAAPPPQQVSDAEAAALRRELAAGEDLLGLMVGRVAPQKNYELLIRAAEHARDLPITVVIAGAEDPEVRAALEATLEHTDLGRFRIVFLGQRRDVSALMRAADFFLLTSHWEARALVVQEALLAGTPIIASDVGGITGLVDGAGILIDPAGPNAPTEFAQALRKFTDPHTRAQFGLRAAQRGRELPGEAEVAEILLDHYRRVLRS